MTDRTHPDSGRTTGGIVEMLQDRVAELEAQLSSSGFTAADMATAEARGFRDGRASLAASAGTNCERCSGSGEDPEGFYDQSRGDAGHTHDGPCRACDGSGVAANAGNEPVAWMNDEGDVELNHKPWMSDVWKPLYLHPSPPEGMVAEQALRKVLSVVQRYLPPDGPTAHDAMTEITEIVDPWPLGPLEKP